MLCSVISTILFHFLLGPLSILVSVSWSPAQYFLKREREREKKKRWSWAGEKVRRIFKELGGGKALVAYIVGKLLSVRKNYKKTCLIIYLYFLAFPAFRNIIFQSLPY